MALCQSHKVTKSQKREKNQQMNYGEKIKKTKKNNFSRHFLSFCFFTTNSFVDFFFFHG